MSHLFVNIFYMEDPKEFIDGQFMSASPERLQPVVHFYDENTVSCPFCGQRMKSSVENGFTITCDCKDFTTVEEKITEYKKLNAEVSRLVAQQNDIIDQINNYTRPCAYRTIAKHYFQNEEGRAGFNNEIKAMTKL